MIGCIPDSRIQHHFIIIKNLGSYSAPQHPDESISLKSGGSLPRLHHLGSLVPHIVLQTPPVTTLTNLIILKQNI